MHRRIRGLYQGGKIDRCQLSDPAIGVSDRTAVAFYEWTMVYTMKEQQYRESGHGVFVLTRADGK